MRAFQQLAVAAPLLLLGVLLSLSASGCSALPGADDHAIRQAIERLRAATVAGNAEAILRETTPDAEFVIAGKALSHAGFRERLHKQFERYPVESMATRITFLEERGRLAEAMLRQTIVRVEPEPNGGTARWHIEVAENQEWVKTTEGWRVSRIEQFPQERRRIAR